MIFGRFSFRKNILVTVACRVSMGGKRLKKHLERGLSGTGLMSPREAAAFIFTEVAKTARSIEFSEDKRAIIIDKKIVIRPSKSSGIAVDLVDE